MRPITKRSLRNINISFELMLQFQGTLKSFTCGEMRVAEHRGNWMLMLTQLTSGMCACWEFHGSALQRFALPATGRKWMRAIVALKALIMSQEALKSLLDRSNWNEVFCVQWAWQFNDSPFCSVFKSCSRAEMFLSSPTKLSYRKCDGENLILSANRGREKIVI